MHYHKPLIKRAKVKYSQSPPPSPLVFSQYFYHFQSNYSKVYCMPFVPCNTPFPFWNRNRTGGALYNIHKSFSITRERSIVSVLRLCLSMFYRSEIRLLLDHVVPSRTLLLQCSQSPGLSGHV